MLKLGRIEILLEAKCNGLHAFALQDWSEQGRVHMVLKVGGEIIQPLATGSAGAVYGSAILQTPSASTWFDFPEVQGFQSAIVSVISGSGKAKEKEVTIK